MTAPTLTSEQQLRLHMTQAGYDLALTTYGADMVPLVAAQYVDLRLAAAKLLEGLPQTSGEGGGGLSSFKLDVLEFKFQSGSSAQSADWLAIARRLRAEVAGEGHPRRAANPAPEIQGWELR